MVAHRRRRPDFYSLGVLMYYMVTGKYPVRADNIAELQKAHATGIASLRDQRPDLDDDFLRIVEWCLDRDPDRRPGTAGALAEALSASLAEASERSRVRPVFGWIAGTVAVLLVLAVSWVLRSPGYLLEIDYLLSGAGQPPTAITDGSSVRLGDRLEIELTLDMAVARLRLQRK